MNTCDGKMGIESEGEMNERMSKVPKEMSDTSFYRGAYESREISCLGSFPYG